MVNKLVVIGDIVGSKELDSNQRKKLQTDLQKKLNEINKSSDELLSPYTITLGDEFQAVYQSADHVLKDSWKLLAELHPVKIRFSISTGAITTPLNKKQALGMDGPVFHAARNGIDELKNSDWIYTANITRKDDNSIVISLVNDVFKMVSKEMAGWNKTRFDILNMLASGLPIKQIAKKMAITESAVYKNRHSGGLEIILSMEETIAKILNNEL